VACELTIRILDAHMAFEPSPELEGAEGDVPDPIIDVLEADIAPGASDGDVDPLAVPLYAPGGADVAHLEAVGIVKRWPFIGHLPGGGFVTCCGCAHVERLVRPLMVALVAAVVALLLLGVQAGAGRAGGVGFQRALQALVAAVLVRCAGFDARRRDARTYPPRGQLGQPGQDVGGARHAVVGADAPRQAACFEDACEQRCDLRSARR
jgi:hypothetical protein